jgi:hypothetical protein
VPPSVAVAADPPTNLSSIGISTTAIKLDWTRPCNNGNSAITGYRIEYTPAGGAVQTVDTNSVNTSYTLSGLNPETTYTIRVATLNKIGEKLDVVGVSTFVSSSAKTTLPNYTVANSGSLNGTYVLEGDINNKPYWVRFTNGTPSAYIYAKGWDQWILGPILNNGWNSPENLRQAISSGVVPPLSGWLDSPSFSLEPTPPVPANTPCSNSVSLQRPNDCYNEGIAPNYAQDLPIGTERKGPLDVTMTLQYANGTDGFKIWKEKSGTKILNATGLVSNGWQKTLNRVGNALSASDFTTSSNIAGRVCPPNVFINHDLMTAADRCLYFDNGSSVQRLDAAGTSTSETSDWLQGWNRPLTGRGIGSSFYEGNIKTCADKGMRLPALYETSIPEAAAKASMMGSPGEYLPTGDSITPVWAENNGVPTNSMNWTATAHVPDSNNFWNWHGTGGGNWSFSDTIAARCVVPSHSKTDDPPPPPIITEAPAPPSPPPSASGSFCAFGSYVMGGWTYTNATKAECAAVGLDTCGDIPENALCGCGHPHGAPSCTEYYMGPTSPSLPTGVAGPVSQEDCPDTLLNAAKQINSSTGCSEFASQNPGFEIKWIQK